jgi:Holliday junction resolvase RusA-like endonuclease
VKWTVEIPNWLPTGLNEMLRMHWAARRKRFKVNARLVGAYLKLAGVFPAGGRRRVTLHFQARNNTPDADNWKKELLDCLVECRALVDDSPRWAEVPEPRCSAGRSRRTVIEIEDIEEAPSGQTEAGEG